ncbi:hypothetical protein [Ramlibacter pallidus]|uniref:Stress-induced protein n=1 Tax=Ramlibacter pallidus TaxID=2780087 RepID=A0ABR9S3B0_9BURK|nr:hypothetical protein [Ramlibacter pallidus]MBE7367547.1 hypothetical protein [Ramlibacter pallidus]
MTHRYKNHPQDEQAGQSGKNANDTNKLGNQAPTQKNEGRRTPESRHDREDHIGGKANQKLVRTGMAGQGDKGGPNSRTGRKP